MRVRAVGVYPYGQKILKIWMGGRYRPVTRLRENGRIDRSGYSPFAALEACPGPGGFEEEDGSLDRGFFLLTVILPRVRIRGFEAGTDGL